MKGKIRKLLFFALFLFSVTYSFGNPFLQDSESVVRAPTTAGVMPEFQIGLRNQAAESINSFIESPSLSALILLFGASFLYGLIHAAGPGHRKTVIFSLFLSRDSKVWEPLAAGFLAAFIHAGTGILLVLILSLIRGSIAGLGQAELIRSYIDGLTFGVILLLSVFLLILCIIRIKKRTKEVDGQINAKGLYGIIAVSSAVPCPGATMILLFAMYAGALMLGIFAVLLMSLGMGVVISFAGYLAYTGRAGLFGSLKSKEKLLKTISEITEILAYLILFAFSLYMLLPFLSSL